MTTITGQTATLKFRDGEWKTLGASRLVAASVRCATLTEGQDFEVDYDRGTVRRLRVVAEGLHTFTFSCDDRVAEFANTESTLAIADLQAQYATAVTRLDQIGTQMAAIVAASSMTTAQQLAAFKSLANAVSDEATMLKRTLRLLKATAT